MRKIYIHKSIYIYIENMLLSAFDKETTVKDC